MRPIVVVPFEKFLKGCKLIAMAFVEVEELFNFSVTLRVFDAAEDVLDAIALEEIAEEQGKGQPVTF